MDERSNAQIGPVPIRPAGMPGEATLELRGTVLLYRRASWVALSSAYLPVEWLEVREYERRDWQRFWRGVLGLMIALLFTLPLFLLLVFRCLLLPWDALWIVPLCALWLGAAITGAILLFRFGVPRPCTCIAAGGGPGLLAIHFWRDGPSALPDSLLAVLLERLRECSASLPRTGVPAIHVSPGWFQPLPYRMALLKGLIVSFFLYIALLSWAAMLLMSGRTPIPAWNFAILLLPPLTYAALTALRDLAALREPKAYRAARRAYRRGALEGTRDTLSPFLDAQPAHVPGRLLMVRVCAELWDLDAAFQHCGQLARAHPAEGRRLEENLWALRRLHERMRQRAAE